QTCQLVGISNQTSRLWHVSSKLALSYQSDMSVIAEDTQKRQAPTMRRIWSKIEVPLNKSAK
ncbi:hypothetical protein P3736_25445, partial [Vibrio parahaemolyticus]|nr:hypothetical protein [Vibrio parahaemolyticus]